MDETRRSETAGGVSDMPRQAWFEKVGVRNLEIKRRLKDEPVGPQRSRLVRELFRLKTLEKTQDRML